MPSSIPPPFALSVLVVEDHALIAMDLESMLLDLGAGQVTIANTLDQALSLVTARKFDAAFLDVRLDDNTSFHVARALHAKCVPFAITTGYDSETEIPTEYRMRPHITKPYQEKDIIDFWQTLVTLNRAH